ncbi:DUF6531 domain-containing protein [Embleya scabrispora]|uniref:DUF6531 domain-containing protein n=1 Tax=Embleya scabrispora TaxID=159449 RepID=UPI00036EB418|nr:DUF6531 domain-containing protein [Embleya scabrispora]MYS84563.1 type IV secretion protein Rhs [Streptomyces sp. SID5474]
MLVSGEPLTPDSQPRGLIPGDWEVLHAVADVFTRFSVQALEAKDRLGKVDGKDLWRGDAAEGFRKDLKLVTEVLKLHGKEYPSVAKKLREFAEVLRFAQGECANEIIPKARQAFWLIEAQAREQESYDLAKRNQDVQKANGVGKECLPQLPHKPEGHPGADMLREAQEQLKRVRERVEKADAHAMLELRKSVGVLDLDPDVWKTLGNAGIEFLKGGADAFFELASFAGVVDPARAYLEPAAYATDLKNIATGMLGMARDPIGFAQDSLVTSWEDFKKNPARFLGHLAPDLALTLATRGGNKALTPAEKAIAKRDNPRCRGADACTREGEPIDVVTGEMVLPQTDVTLAGALPLVLERHHRTAFGGGRWFGERWASTFDQYLQLGSDRVTFTAADGMVLRYPVPRPGERVMPMGGYRWPLVWDGAPNGTFTVSDPQRGRSWSFAALPEVLSRRIPVRAVVDRNGSRIDYLYDEAGVPCEVTHSGGYRVAVDTAGGLITGFRLLGADPVTHMRSDDSTASVDLVTFAYGESGDLLEVVNSSGRPLRFTYDEHHRMTSWTDRNGTWYQYEYDEAGRCVRGSGVDGIMDNTFEYDIAARITRMTDALGAVREYEYNDWSQVIRETDPLGGTRSTEWDSYNRRVAVTDELGHTTRYSYDALGNTVGVVLPNGTFTVADFDPLLCRPTLVTGLDGGRRRYTYDERANLLTATDELGAVTSYMYDEAGRMSVLTNSLGHTTTVDTDGSGLPLAITDPLGATTTVIRNAFGRSIATVDPIGGTTHTAWTIEGKPAWRERPDGARESWTWDGEGTLRRHTNAAGFITTYECTRFDLPAARTDPDGARLEFTYDAELRLTRVTNPQGRTWDYEYDPAGRLLAETDFNGRKLTYHHDAAGRLTQRINGAGEVITYSRDALGRMTAELHAATGHETTHQYDAAGYLIRATNADVDLVFTRDALGRVIEESSNGRTFSSTYNALGRRIRRRTPSGHTSEWTYDPKGRPSSLTAAGHTLEFAYDAADREVQRRFGSRVAFTQEWNETHRLERQAIRVGLPVSKLALTVDPTLESVETYNRTYTYRADGYVSSIDETTTGLALYDLDEVGRVTDVRNKGWTEHYAYDAAGNQVRSSWPGPDQDFQGASDVTGTLIGRIGRTHYTHDAQGRVIRRSRKTLSGKSLTWSYIWDADDRLLNVVTPDGTRWHYTYDPLARRVAKRTDDAGFEITFDWDGPRLAYQTTMQNDESLWEYRPGSFHPLLQADFHRRGERGAQEHVNAVATDLVGTPIRLVDETGRVNWQARKSLWGVTTLPETGSIQCPLRFPGQYFDAETGLHFNTWRYYEPETGRFLSPDPLGLAPAENNYTYPRNPHILFDPLGLAPGDYGDGWKLPANVTPPELDEWSIKNVRDYHFDGGPLCDPVNKGVFNSTVTDGQLHEIFETGMKNGIPGPMNKSNYYERIFDFKKTVGTASGKTGGGATSWVMIVHDKWGSVITMYPVAVPG